VLIHLVAKAGVADLIQPEELVQTLRASIRHHQTMERHRQARLAQRLDGTRLAQNPCAGRNDDVLSAVGIDRICHQTVHGRDAVPIETVRQHRIDDGALQEGVHGARRAQRWGALWRCPPTGAV
jgi:hypothetical protein